MWHIARGMMTPRTQRKAEAATQLEAVLGHLTELRHAGRRIQRIDDWALTPIAMYVEAGIEQTRQRLIATGDAMAGTAVDLSQKIVIHLEKRGYEMMVRVRGRSGQGRIYLLDELAADETIDPALFRRTKANTIESAKYRYSIQPYESIVLVRVRPIADLDCIVTTKNSFDKSGATLLPVADPAPSETTVDRRRRTAPLKNPEKPRWAEENRPKKQFNVRFTPELIERLEKISQERGISRNDLVEAAVKLYLDPK